MARAMTIKSIKRNRIPVWYLYDILLRQPYWVCMEVLFSVLLLCELKTSCKEKAIYNV